MLCGSMFTAQFMYIVGFGRTENEVCRGCPPLTDLLHTAGCLFSHCCVAPLPVPGDVHVDADGGCGLVCETSQSVHHTS